MREVPAHQDDLFGAEPFGGQHGHQAYGAVADHGDGGARADAGLDGGVVAGAVHVRQGQKRWDQRRVLAGWDGHEGAVRERDPHGLGLQAADVTGVPEATVTAGGLQAFTAEVTGAVGPRDGAITSSPFLTVVTALPVSSTTPMHSCPIDAPSGVTGMEW